MNNFFSKVFGGIRMLCSASAHPSRIKLHGIKYHLGKGSKLIVNKGAIEFGKKAWIDRNSTFEVKGGNILLGDNNFFNTNCKVIALNKITIGNDNLFGPNVVILDHNHKYSDKTRLICKQGFDVKEINIGSNIWIGANVTICAGVSICDNVVVGANSVVTKDISKSGVYAGVPAKFIKEL